MRDRAESPISNFKVLRDTLYICIPVFLIVSAITIYFFWQHNRFEKDKILQSQRVNLNLKTKFLEHDIKKITSDLCFLVKEAKRHYIVKQDGSVNLTEKYDLTLDFLNFSDNKNIYHQIRLIDSVGNETIRIDNEGTNAVIISDEKLQNKAVRYYVKEGLKLKEGQIYISKFDLNIENKQLELPIRPMIRFCCPVYNDNGHKLGLVVLNYQGKYMLENLKSFGSEIASKQILLNSDGYWLAGGSEMENWAFMYDDRKNISFASKYPVQWQKINAEDKGQFESDRGLFTFATIQLSSNENIASIIKLNEDIDRIYSKDLYWKIISFYPKQQLYVESYKSGSIVILLGFIFCCIFAVLWMFVKTKLAKRLIQIDLKKAKAKAEAANYAKSKFLANMSHEIRTPMNAIMGISQTIIRKPENMSKSQIEAVDTIYKSGQRLLNLINGILDLSKVEAGKMEPHLEAFSLRDVVSLLRATVDSLIGSKDVAFVIEQTDNLPDRIVSDCQMIHQILLNMAANAVKFTEQGNIVLSIKYEKGKLYFKLADSGIGMSTETLEHIFNEFEQADSSSTRKYQGSGLGLTIAKKFIEILGGQINVQSQLGTGTTFDFFVPVKVEKRGFTEKTGDFQEIAFKNNRPEKKYRILVAEDDKFNQQAIGMMLEDICDISFADNGADALEKFAPDKFDLIFSDIEMPVMDGCSFIDELRQKYTDLNVPVIAMTAWAMNEDQKNIMQHGFDDYITKPVDYDKLMSVIGKYGSKVNY